MKRGVILCSLLACITVAAVAAPVTTNNGRTGNKPLAFIENKGQVTSSGKPRADIDVKLEAPGMNVFTGDGQLHYQFSKRAPQPHLSKADKKSAPASAEVYRLDVVLVGADKNAELIKSDKQPYYENYFTAATPGGATAFSYNQITYRNIYPNIDWVLYTSNNELKYDFIVRPGGKVSDIKLRYAGATSLTMKDGAVTATTPLGSITEQKPYTYEATSKREVASSFKLSGNTLSFDVAPHEGTLVIDPVLAWGTYYGENGNDDFAEAVATDALGNVYMAGYTYSDDDIVDPQLPAHQHNIQGLIDAFIVKFDPETGQRIWSTYYGHGGDEYCYDIKVHPNGDLYICGNSDSPAGLGFPSTVYQDQNNGGFDAFLARFSPNGTWVWGTYFGGPDHEECYALDFGVFGDIFITGSTKSQTDIAYPGASQFSNAGGTDAFVAKFNQNGLRQWATYYGGFTEEVAYDLAVNANGSVYITGSTVSPDITTTPNVHRPSYGDPTKNAGDGFLAKFDNDGNMQMSTYYGGRGSDIGYALEIDDMENVYLAGFTNSYDSIATAGAFKTVKSFNGPDTFTEGFLGKLDEAGTLLWGTYFGDIEHLQFRDILIDQQKRIYAVGRTNNTTGVSTPGSHQPNFNGPNGWDGFVTQWSPQGQRVWGTYYGGIYNEDITGIAADKRGKLFFCGSTNSPANIATPGTHNPIWVGNPNYPDAFLVKFHDTVAVIDTSFVPTPICPPDTFSINYEVYVIFGATNSFYAQLSDTNGSFANPVTIGYFTSNNSGSIKCTIPANTPPGNGYRVRIVSSSPVFTTGDNGKDIRVLERAIPVIAGTESLCAQDSVKLSASSNVASALYQWTGPNGFTATGPAHTIPNAPEAATGSYIVTASNENCGAADTFDVLVKPKPWVMDIGNTGPVCEGQQLGLYAESSMSNVSYQWSGPDGFVSVEKAPVIQESKVENTGWYNVLLVATNGCTSDSVGTQANVRRLEVKIEEVPLRTPGDTIKLEATANTDSVQWQWTGPNGFTSNIEDPMIEDITAAYRGDYFVVISKDGCVGRASIHVRISEEVEFLLYPNPNNGQFTIEGNTENDQVIEMEITDAAGRAIYRDSTKTFRKHFRKNISLPVEPAVGVYILRLDVEGKKSDVKFVIMK